MSVSLPHCYVIPRGPFLANKAHIIFSSLRLALELMHQLPICTAHDVPGYSRIRGRYGILLRVSRSNICPEHFGEDLTHTFVDRN
jgi:hypothetical protein